jgi:hypothetical protein
MQYADNRSLGDVPARAASSMPVEQRHDGEI